MARDKGEVKPRRILNYHLTGLVVNRLTIIGKVPVTKGKARWRCQCECGNILTVEQERLVTKDVKRKRQSCGCAWKESILAALVTHGKTNSQEMKTFYSAKKRAKDKSMEFNLEWTDIVIPERCPLLGIPLSPGTGKFHDGSPALDRIDSTFGYIKGNVQVISQRANTIKSYATFAEFEKMYLAWKDSLCPPETHASDCNCLRCLSLRVD